MRWRLGVVLLCVALGACCPGPHGHAAADDPEQHLDEPVQVRPTAATVTGGQEAEFTVSLLGVTENGRTVAISTDQPGVFVALPASVVVPAGHSSVTFTAMTYEVGSPVAATVTATYGGDQGAARLTVVP